jgi:hypothetical protein
MQRATGGPNVRGNRCDGENRKHGINKSGMAVKETGTPARKNDAQEAKFFLKKEDSIASGSVEKRSDSMEETRSGKSGQN